MFNKRKFGFIPALVLLTPVLSGCNLEAVPDGTSIMTAINYQSGTRMIYDQDTVYETPGGKNPSRKVSKGDYKPVFLYIQNKLNITLLEHQGAANSGEKKSVAYFRDNWLNKPYADISMGTVDAITKYSVQGNKETILDLRPYLFDIDPTVPGGIRFKEDDETPLPNLKKFFEDNPGLIRSMMTAKHSHPDQGAIYYAPYCDGFQDLERLTMVRADYIKKLLDEDSSSFDTDTSILGPVGSSAKYKLSYDKAFDVDASENAPAYKVSVPNDLAKGGIAPELKEINKTITKNIIVQQNELIKEGKASSKAMVEQFKDYFDIRYGKPTSIGGTGFFEKYSDLFLRYDACYDPDELVALMRIIKVSPRSLNLYIYDSEDEGAKIIGPKEMVIWFPKECDNSCSSDLYRWAGNLFGVRGPESRTGYLYLNGKLGNDIDKVHDCRGDEDMRSMLYRLNKLYNEGLILKDFDEKQSTGGDGKFGRDLITNCTKTSKLAGFMGYGSAATDGNLNFDDKEKKQIEGYEYRPIVGAVSKWNTDDNKNNDDVRMQFTESWISIRTSGLCLNADLVKTPKKLAATFKFLDFMFSPLGQAVYNFGPEDDGYIEPGFFDEETGKPKKDPDPDSYIEYKGEKIPKFTEAAKKQNKQYDGFLRKYVGATIPMAYVKTLGGPYQLTAEVTQKGIDNVNTAIIAGTFRHPCIDEKEYKWTVNPGEEAFYKIVPSSFCLTKGQLTSIAALLDKTKLGSMFTDNRGTDSFNIWDGYVMGQKKDIAPDLDKYCETVNGDWHLPKLVTYYQDAYEYLMS